MAGRYHLLHREPRLLMPGTMSSERTCVCRIKILRGLLSKLELRTCLAEAENALLWQALKICRDASMIAGALWDTGKGVAKLRYFEK